GMTPHNLIIQAPDAGVAVEVDLGTEPKKVVFTPTKTGKYPIYCSKKLPFMAGHREKGMEGVLEVVP
ncbi:MAG: quinol oxidase, partial [Burkholderiales bacterium]